MNIEFAKNPADKVSSKIRQLVSEGYPQKQAVAIALQMAKDSKLKRNPSIMSPSKYWDTTVKNIKKLRSHYLRQNIDDVKMDFNALLMELGEEIRNFKTEEVAYRTTSIEDLGICVIGSCDAISKKYFELTSREKVLKTATIAQEAYGIKYVYAFGYAIGLEALDYGLKLKFPD